MAISNSNFLDGRLGIAGNASNELFRDAIQLQTVGEPRDTLKMNIGIAGVQYSGSHIFDTIKKNRNPLQFPEHVLRQMFRYESVNHYNSTLQLSDKMLADYHLHAHWMESMVVRLRIGTSGLLSLFGKDVIGEHGEIQKLGESAMLAYISLAALARGNRSLALKFKDAASEHLMAACLLQENARRVKTLMEHIEQGPEETFETHYQSLTKLMVASKAYNLMHPCFRFM